MGQTFERDHTQVSDAEQLNLTTKCVMSLAPPTENQNGVRLVRKPRSFKPLILGRVCHSRMLLAGIQAEFGLDPRLKHSGVTILGSRISSPQPQFSKEFTRFKNSNIRTSVDFVVNAYSSSDPLWRTTFSP